GHLAGGIAHEFNNFLGVILGFSELLSEEAVENEKVGRIASGSGAVRTRRRRALGRRLVGAARLAGRGSAAPQSEALRAGAGILSAGDDLSGAGVHGVGAGAFVGSTTLRT